MRLPTGTAAALAGLAASIAWFTTAAVAGLYWGQGVRAREVSVCFVGDALTSRPNRVQQVLTYIREFEYAAMVRFPAVPVTCAAPTTQPNGNDHFDGDIRVVLPSTSVNGTGAVPGNGCLMFRDASGNYNGGNNGWGSWSNAPDDLAGNRSCLYNLKLGDDPWNATPYLNHTLHEFGHGLGLAHEHERSDVTTTLCSASGYGGSASSGWLTAYDSRSVMHYMFSTCGINGNYDHTGLSARDQLAVHILYPEDARVAEFVGTTVARAGSRVVLRSAWQGRAAHLPFAAKSWKWTVNSNIVSTTHVLDVQLPQGNHAFTFEHDDFLGRHYSYQGIIRILSPTAYTRQISGPVAARLALH